jgi:hypothetical protein
MHGWRPPPRLSLSCTFLLCLQLVVLYCFAQRMSVCVSACMLVQEEELFQMLSNKYNIPYETAISIGECPNRPNSPPPPGRDLLSCQLGSITWCSCVSGGFGVV